MPSTNLEERARELAQKVAALLDPQQLATIGKGGRVPSTTLRYNVRQAKKAIEPLALALLTRVQAEARERLAGWMIEHSFATGHGDTFEDLLKELSWQVKELRQKTAEARLAALEEAAQVIDQCNREGPYNAIQGASRIREIIELEKPRKWIQSEAQAAAPATKEG